MGTSPPFHLFSPYKSEETLKGREEWKGAQRKETGEEELRETDMRQPADVSWGPANDSPFSSLPAPEVSLPSCCSSLLLPESCFASEKMFSPIPSSCMWDFHPPPPFMIQDIVTGKLALSNPVSAVTEMSTIDTPVTPKYKITFKVYLFWD